MNEERNQSSTTVEKIRVLLADDHAVLRQGIAGLLEREADIRVVGQAGSGREALELARERRPDVAVMDLSMPDMNGVQASEKLQATCPDVRVIALTRHTDSAYLEKMWSIGARGYVLKRAPVDDLVRAIRAVARGNTYIDPDLADRFRESVLGRRGQLGATGNASLTGRERDVLSLVAWGHSNTEIARRLEISVKTVEFYRACAVQKLNLRGRSEIVRYAMQQGWLNDDSIPMGFAGGEWSATTADR
jgi:DNA-binding NarL/FixJ family response regulator